MYCRNCGAKLNDNDRFCTYCGTGVTPQNFQNGSFQQAPIHYQPMQIEIPSINTGKATVALVCAIVGLFLCFPGLSVASSIHSEDSKNSALFMTLLFTSVTIVSFVFSIISINFARDAKKMQKRATRSLVFGIVSLCISSYALIIDFAMLMATITANTTNNIYI